MLKRLFPFFIIIITIILSSCSKSESDFLWEKSYGNGEAYFIRSSPDSGLVACGQMDGKPYFIRLDKTRKHKFDFSGEISGLFSAAWYDTSGYITGGNSGGKCY